MLVRRQPECAPVYLGDLAQTSLEVPCRLVLNAAVLNEAREVVLSVVAFDPAEVINVTIECERPWWLKFVAQEFLNLGFEDLQTHSVYGVLETCVLWRVLVRS